MTKNNLRTRIDILNGVASFYFPREEDVAPAMRAIANGLEDVGREVYGFGFIPNPDLSNATYQLYFRGAMEEPEDLVA